MKPINKATRIRHSTETMTVIANNRALSMIKILLIVPNNLQYSGPGVTMVAWINFDLRWNVHRKCVHYSSMLRVIKIENTSIMPNRLISFQYSIEHDTRRCAKPEVPISDITGFDFPVLLWKHSIPNCNWIPWAIKYTQVVDFWTLFCDVKTRLLFHYR